MSPAEQWAPSPTSSARAFTKSAGASAIDTASLGNAGKTVQDAANENQGGKLLGKGAGLALVSGAGNAPVSAAETALGRVAARGATGGLEGFLSKPAGDDSVSARASNAGKMRHSAAYPGRRRGRQQAGDWLMQKQLA